MSLLLLLCGVFRRAGLRDRRPGARHWFGVAVTVATAALAVAPPAAERGSPPPDRRYRLRQLPAAGRRGWRLRVAASSMARAPPESLRAARPATGCQPGLALGLGQGGLTPGVALLLGPTSLLLWIDDGRAGRRW